MKLTNLFAAGGWVFAIVAVCIAVFVKSKRSGDAPADAETAVVHTAAQASEAAKSEPAQAVAAERGAEPAPVGADDADDDFELPDDPCEPEALFALLRNASEADRALGRDILADIKKGGSDTSLKLVVKAAKSGNKNLHMLAIQLLQKCVDSAGDQCPEEKAAELAQAAHAFCESKEDDVSLASFETFCFAARLNQDDAGRCELAKSALMDWKYAECGANVAFRALVPDRYAFRHNYEFGVGKGDIGEWARMFADVIDGAENKEAVVFAREYYEALTQTVYTTREDADKWIARRQELKEQGAKLHPDDTDFDAEKWATCCEDSER